MRAEIFQTGEPVLRRQAAPIDPADIASRSIQRLIEIMQATMRNAPGVGLAAPQVGESIQLVVIEDKEEYHRSWTPEQLSARGRQPIEFHVLINPDLSVEDRTEKLFFEGCLSVIGYTAVVRRASTVRVRALNEHGEPFECVAHDWYARILQHEVDHLKGRLYTDRMERWSFMANKQWEGTWKNEPVTAVKQILEQWDADTEQRSVGAHMLSDALLRFGLDPTVVKKALAECKLGSEV